MPKAALTQNTFTSPWWCENSPMLTYSSKLSRQTQCLRIKQAYRYYNGAHVPALIVRVNAAHTVPAPARKRVGLCQCLSATRLLHGDSCRNQIRSWDHTNGNLEPRSSPPRVNDNKIDVWGKKRRYERPTCRTIDNNWTEKNWMRVWQLYTYATMTWLMIAFITCKSSLVPLLEGLCTSNPCRFEFSVIWVFAG